MDEKPWYENKIIVFLTILFIVLIAAPFIINLAYLHGTKDGHVNTAFSAGDMLSLYGGVLSLIGTVSLGILAFWQNHRLNKINQQLQKVQNAPLYSVVDLSNFQMSGHEAEKAYYRLFKKDEIIPEHIGHFSIELQNTSEHIITNVKIQHGCFEKVPFDDFNHRVYFTGESTEREFHLGGKETKLIRIAFRKYIMPSLLMSDRHFVEFTFGNVFGFETTTRLTFNDNVHKVNIIPIDLQEEKTWTPLS